MIHWIASNIAAIIIFLVVIAIVALAVAVLVRDKKKGKSSCGGNCGCCPMGGSCHNHK